LTQVDWICGLAMAGGANDSNCGTGDVNCGGGWGSGGDGGYDSDSSDGGILAQAAEMNLYGSNYCDLPGACSFGIVGLLGEFQYSNMVSSAGQGPPADPEGETIFVHCIEGDILNIMCVPDVDSWQYFQPGQLPFFTNPDTYDNYKVWLTANAVVFDTEHPLGNDLHSSMCGYAGFMGESLAVMSIPATAGSAFELSPGYLSRAAATQARIGAAGSFAGIGLTLGSIPCS